MLYPNFTKKQLHIELLRQYILYFRLCFFRTSPKSNYILSYYANIFYVYGYASPKSNYILSYYANVFYVNMLSYYANTFYVNGYASPKSNNILSYYANIFY